MSRLVLYQWPGLFIFGAGRLEPDQIFTPDQSELRRYAFLGVDEARQRLRPCVWLRLGAPLKAAEPQTVAYLDDEPRRLMLTCPHVRHSRLALTVLLTGMNGKQRAPKRTDDSRSLTFPQVICTFDN